MVKAEVHILNEKRQEVWAIEPTIEMVVLKNLLPDLPLLAAGRLGQILRGVELLHVRKWAGDGGVLRVVVLLSIQDFLGLQVESRRTVC